MVKKDFSNPALDFLTKKPAQTQDTQDTQGTQETPYKLIAQGTQGKKGQKLPRINMAFTQDNLEHLQIMARIEGVSMTEYVNRLVRADQANQADIVAKAKEVLKGAE